MNVLWSILFWNILVLKWSLQINYLDWHDTRRWSCPCTTIFVDFVDSSPLFVNFWWVRCMNEYLSIFGENVSRSWNTPVVLSCQESRYQMPPLFYEPCEKAFFLKKCRNVFIKLFNLQFKKKRIQGNKVDYMKFIHTLPPNLFLLATLN
jgi:hypothetical protein